MPEECPSFLVDAFVPCMPDASFTSILMVMYTSIPLVLLVGSGIGALAFRYVATRSGAATLARLTRPSAVRSRMGFFVIAVLLGGAGGFNEVILKNIIRQPRPEGSCSCSPGYVVLAREACVPCRLTPRANRSLGCPRATV